MTIKTQFCAECQQEIMEVYIFCWSCYQKHMKRVIAQNIPWAEIESEDK